MNQIDLTMSSSEENLNNRREIKMFYQYFSKENLQESMSDKCLSGKY